MIKRFFCELMGHNFEVIKYMVTPFQLIFDERCTLCGHVNAEVKTLSVHVELKKYNPIGVVSD